MKRCILCLFLSGIDGCIEFFGFGDGWGIVVIWFFCVFFVVGKENYECVIEFVFFFKSFKNVFDVVIYVIDYGGVSCYLWVFLFVICVILWVVVWIDIG